MLIFLLTSYSYSHHIVPTLLSSHALVHDSVGRIYQFLALSAGGGCFYSLGAVQIICKSKSRGRNHIMLIFLLTSYLRCYPPMPWCILLMQQSISSLLQLQRNLVFISQGLSQLNVSDNLVILLLYYYILRLYCYIVIYIYANVSLNTSNSQIKSKSYWYQTHWINFLPLSHPLLQGNVRERRVVQVDLHLVVIERKKGQMLLLQPSPPTTQFHQIPPLCLLILMLPVQI